MTLREINRRGRWGEWHGPAGLIGQGRSRGVKSSQQWRCMMYVHAYICVVSFDFCMHAYVCVVCMYLYRYDTCHAEGRMVWHIAVIFFTEYSHTAVFTAQQLQQSYQLVHNSYRDILATAITGISYFCTCCADSKKIRFVRIPATNEHSCVRYSIHQILYRCSCPEVTGTTAVIRLIKKTSLPTTYICMFLLLQHNRAAVVTWISSKTDVHH